MIAAVRAYSRFLSAAGVPRLAATAATSRLTTSMLSLSLLLSTVEVTDSYRDGGAVLFAHALSLAACTPIGGRMADAWGPRRTLLILVLLHALAYAALLVALGTGAPAPYVIAFAACVGATTPPALAITRRTWPLLISTEDLRTAYAFDSALNSLAFVIGPLVVALLVLALPAVTVLALAGATKIVGDLLLAIGPYRFPQTPQSESQRARRMIGPLSDKSLLLLLGIIALDTFMLGCMQVGAAATAPGAAAGLLLSALAIGEVVGGLVYGARGWRIEMRKQFLALHVCTAGILALTNVMPEFSGIALVYLLAGVTSGARDTLGQLTVGEITPAAYKTEAFAWLSTFMWAGFGIGTLTAGSVQSAAGSNAIFTVALGASLVAAVAVTTLRSTAEAGSSP